MTERIILSIVSILMFSLTIRRAEKWSVILTGMLTFGILITLTKIPILISSGIIIYMISALFIIIYGINNKEFKKYQKVIIAFTGFHALVALLFSINHWPYANELYLSMIIPLILYLVLIGKGMINRKEFGFMTILNLEFFFRFLKLWE